MKTIDFEELATTLRTDPHAQEEIERERREALAEAIAYNLAELRKAKAITQTELATLLGVRQPAVSQLEHTEDPHLSTLRAYVEALGGRLEIAAVFDEERLLLEV